MSDFKREQTLKKDSNTIFTVFLDELRYAASLARRRLPGSRKSTRGSEASSRSPSRPWTPFSNLFSMTPRFRRPMTSKSVRFEDEPPMTPASWRSRPRTGQSLTGFESPSRPLTGTSTPRPRTSGSVRFADEVEVEDLEDPLEMMSQTAPAALYSNEELFNSTDPLEKKVARMELHFRTDVDEWLTENGTSSPVKYEQFANTMTDVYMAKLDGMEGTPAVRAVRKRVIAQIEQLAVGSL